MQKHRDDDAYRLYVEMLYGQFYRLRNFIRRGKTYHTNTLEPFNPSGLSRVFSSHSTEQPIICEIHTTTMHDLIADSGYYTHDPRNLPRLQHKYCKQRKRRPLLTPAVDHRMMRWQ